MDLFLIFNFKCIWWARACASQYANAQKIDIVKRSFTLPQIYLLAEPGLRPNVGKWWEIEFIVTMFQMKRTSLVMIKFQLQFFLLIYLAVTVRAMIMLWLGIGDHSSPQPLFCYICKLFSPIIVLGREKEVVSLGRLCGFFQLRGFSAYWLPINAWKACFLKYLTGTNKSKCISMFFSRALLLCKQTDGILTWLSNH